MPAEARSRIERMEAERLGCGGIDDLPDVQIHAQAEHLELVHERDVHAAIDVFQQLRHLRCGRRRDRNGAAEDRPIKCRRQFRSPAGSRPPITFGMSWRATCVLPGSSRSGEKATQNSLSRCCPCARRVQAGLVFLLENRNQHFFRGPGIGCALQNNNLPGAQMRRDRVGGVGDVAEVGLVIFVERRGDADDDRIHGRRSASSSR